MPDFSLHTGSGLAGFVASVVTDSAGRVLLASSSPSCTFLPGLWCTPGGVLASGELPASVACREIRSAGIAVNADQLDQVLTLQRHSGVHWVFRTPQRDWVSARAMRGSFDSSTPVKSRKKPRSTPSLPLCHRCHRGPADSPSRTSPTVSSARCSIAICGLSS